VQLLTGPPTKFRCGLLASQLCSERSPRRSDSCRLIQYTSRGLPASPLGFEPKARRFDSCLVFHFGRGARQGPRRTEVETEVVSAVRAPESRLARRRCELRSRVPHEDAVSAASKLAQWVEQRFGTPWVVGSTPMLAPASEAGSRESAGPRPRIEVPRRRRRSAALACKGRVVETQRPQRAFRLER
jgi:hypothetical protein